MNTRTNSTTEPKERTPAASVKRPYGEPKLNQIGRIREITGGPNGGTIDSLTGGSGGFQSATS